MYLKKVVANSSWPHITSHGETVDGIVDLSMSTGEESEIIVKPGSVRNVVLCT